MYHKKCPTCDSNFSTKDKRQKYCKRKCYSESLKGNGNHFYGKKHKKESIDSMKEKLSEQMSGEKNPFFGKTHTEESKKKIVEKNEIYRKENKELLLLKRLSRKNLTREKVEEIWEQYCSGPYNNKWIQEVSGVDYRTIKSLVADLGISTPEEIKGTGERKKLFLGRAVSYPETVLLELLQEAFGKDNVKHQVKRFGYYYDFLLNDDILIEYDGFYFHKVLENKNDKIKNRLAEENGYTLIRIEEDEQRKVFFQEEIKRITKTIRSKNEV